MISNVSRLKTFQECSQKDSYLWEQHLYPNRTPTPLITGGSVHKGLEVFFKTSDAQEAIRVAETTYRERIGEQPFVLPEEQEIYEGEIRYSKKALELWIRQYNEAEFKVLYPEVTFFVELPGSLHHCYFMHKLLHENWTHTLNSCTNPHCIIPHYLKGRCDGVVEKQGKIWLLETKTSGRTGAPFFDQWYLDIQPTAYIWGISKALGIRVNGFAMNVIKKPNKNFKGSLDQFFANSPFERELYIRTDEDLERFERQAKMMFDDRERVHANNLVYMNTGNCVKFNQRCYFFDLCQRHGEQTEGEFLRRPDDYVEEEYLKLAGLQPIKAVSLDAEVENA